MLREAILLFKKISSKYNFNYFLLRSNKKTCFYHCFKKKDGENKVFKHLNCAVSVDVKEFTKRICMTIPGLLKSFLIFKLK